MIISIIGMPGAGKTTLGKNIATRFGFEHISAGDIARQLAVSDAETAKALEDGQFAPRDKMNAVMGELILNHGDRKIVLDGYPRYDEQLAPLLAFEDTVYVLLGCTEEVARQRLAGRGRADDHIEQIDNRIDTFNEETLPLMEFLFDHDRAIYIVAMNTPMDQFNDLSHFLTMACDIRPASTQRAA